ncbi:putative Peptidyl-prolyl cis-trans isomerase FKBP18, chloroplastic [Nannochloris sp. 'desiccata']|nr:hypothetical protein KSW81_001595 [Chlorella desiccata (nom. nud.)]KAH7616740.1 putative Peptidyl-prolyl cis-trans isomerase FKBP18, chloroplastic [Chlorella desiccata (nom. nud.)]
MPHKERAAGNMSWTFYAIQDISAPPEKPAASGQEIDAASSSPTTPTKIAAENPKVSRRAFQGEALLLALLCTTMKSGEAQAIGFKKELKKKKIPIEQYSELANGLKYYDLTTGSGKIITPGTDVTVHYDCIFRGIDVVSSRSARLLGGNRTVAEPFQFLAGEAINAKSVKPVGDSAGGLFSGMGGPKAPPALSTAVVGMKVGGIRSVIVPPELGYGDVGEQEIGPGQTFEMKIEVLEVV